MSTIVDMIRGSSHWVEIRCETCGYVGDDDEFVSKVNTATEIYKLPGLSQFPSLREFLPTCPKCGAFIIPTAVKLLSENYSRVAGDIQYKPSRSSWDDYFLDISLRSAIQGTCMRRNVGATIVDDNRQIISTGYSGAPVGEKHCIDEGKCLRNEMNIPHGKNYEICKSVHAEQNAICQAGNRARNCTMYIASIDMETGKEICLLPCLICAKMIINAGIKAIVVREKCGAVRYLPNVIYQMRWKEATECQ